MLQEMKELHKSYIFYDIQNVSDYLIYRENYFEGKNHTVWELSFITMKKSL